MSEQLTFPEVDSVERVSGDRRSEARRRRDAALVQVTENSTAEWRDAAYEYLAAYCRSHPLLFPDDLRDELAALPGAREARALGPVILKLARRRVIAKTGEYRPRASGNLTPAVVWQSLVYEQ